MSTRLGILCLFAASSIWGQKNLNFGTLSSVPRAEESPLAAAELGQALYDNLRGNETDRVQPQGAFAPAPASRASTVSVNELRHPLSRKAEALIRKAQNFIAMGRHDKAIAELQLALKEPNGEIYAHAMLGSEYLKTQQVPAAVAELEQAVTLLPRNVPTRSNYALALLFAGNLDRSEAEARQALDLDRNNPKTRRVLSQILEARQSRAQTRP